MWKRTEAPQPTANTDHQVWGQWTKLTALRLPALQGMGQALRDTGQEGEGWVYTQCLWSGDSSSVIIPFLIRNALSTGNWDSHLSKFRNSLAFKTESDFFQSLGKPRKQRHKKGVQSAPWSLPLGWFLWEPHPWLWRRGEEGSCDALGKREVAWAVNTAPSAAWES